MKFQNDRVEILILHFLELRPTETLIQSAQFHINEQETRRLYKASCDDRLKHRPWFSFNDQLDQFYEQCLQNKFGPWNIHYFLAKRSTEKEFIVFERKFRRKENLQFQKSFKKAKKNYQKKLDKFDKKVSEQTWSEPILKSKQNEFLNRTSKDLRRAEQRLQKKKDYAAQFPEFLDHELFYGSRITMRWILSEDERHKNELSDQMN